MTSAQSSAFSAALLLLLSFGLNAQDVRDEHDRFTGKREISYTAALDKPIDLRKPVFTVKGEVSDEYAVFIIQLVFAGTSDRRRSSWRFLSCYETNWLVDGKPEKLAAATHRGEVLRSGTLEYISQEITPAQIAKFGMASLIEYRVCNDEFSLSPGDIAAFGVIAAKLQEK